MVSVFLEYKTSTNNKSILSKKNNLKINEIVKNLHRMLSNLDNNLQINSD